MPPYQPPKRTSGGGVPYFLYIVCLCHRVAEDILSLSSHEPYDATASVPSLNSFNPAVMKNGVRAVFVFTREKGASCASPLFSCVSLFPRLGDYHFLSLIPFGIPSVPCTLRGLRNSPRLHRVSNSPRPYSAVCLRYSAKNVAFCIGVEPPQTAVSLIFCI